MKERPVIEFGNEPEYFVTEIRVEQAAAGNMRLLAYVERRDGLHLLYSAVVPVALIPHMARALLNGPSPEIVNSEGELRTH